MKIHVNNLTCQIETDNPALLTALREKYGFKVPGYQYTPQHKRGGWNGKKYYITSRGQFRTGLLQRVLADLKLIGCEPEVVGERDVPKDWLRSPPPIEGFTYYDFQKKTISNAYAEGRLIIKSPTGSGKTLIMAGLINLLKQKIKNPKIVVLFREKGILNQTYKFFTESCKFEDVGVNSGDGYIDGEIMLSTVQSIEKIVDTYLDANVLMIDEAHQFCKGDTTIAAIESFPNATYRFAFTATPPSEKEDIHGRMVLEGAFGPVLDTGSMQEMIDNEIVVKTIIQILNFAPTLTPEDENLTYPEIYDKFIINNDERNNKISDICLAISKKPNTKTLILVKNLQHLKNLLSFMPWAESVEGVNDISARYNRINYFLNQKNGVLIGTAVMQTGINIKEITHMIDARGMVGEIPVKQGLGRGVRKSEGKNEVYFFDFYDKVPYLEAHSKKRIKHYKSEGYEINYVSPN